MKITPMIYGELKAKQGTLSNKVQAPALNSYMKSNVMDDSGIGLRCQ